MNFSGSNDGTICVWNTTTGAMKGVPLTGHTHLVNSVAFSQDGQWIVSGSLDHIIRVWNAATLTRHTDWLKSAAFSQDGQQIVSGSSNNMIHMWDTDITAKDMAIQVDFTDQSMVNSEGWICGPRDDFWCISPIYIEHLSTIRLISGFQVLTQPDLTFLVLYMEKNGQPALILAL